jgi:hypothetical protein
MFHRCATSRDVPANEYHLCFVYEEDDAQNAAAEAPAPAPQVTPVPQKASTKKASVKK